MGLSGAMGRPGAVHAPCSRAAQQDLPLSSAPFAEIARKAGIDEEILLAQCRSLLQRGIMRRYGAAVNHRRVGFTATAMACWAVPAGKVAAAGEKLASLREVSHCYERKTRPEWRYNLFAMIHGQQRERCDEIARRAMDDL